ncbi:GMC oxidoreductase [Fomitopsis betulina]|nr:GMC oxidoreductase [Fomitopsis betulina]
MRFTCAIPFCFVCLPPFLPTSRLKLPSVYLTIYTTSGMGTSQSKCIVSDPDSFAHRISPERDGGPQSRYDYIIVGGGTAGCVLASRLSEDPGVTVLLIEAGRSHEGHWLSRIPLAYTRMFKTDVDWDYHTTPQEAMYGRRVCWHRGRMLGGTSALHSMVYHRCAPEDFDQWESLGARGWGYSDLQPYLDKAEHYCLHPSHPEVKPEDHGLDGPWVVSHSVERAPIVDAALETCGAMGIPHNSDFNSPRGTSGVGELLGHIDEQGQRSSAATAYLDPNVLTRANLTIATETMVEKVIFSGGSEGECRATSIELSKSSTSPRYCAYATREIILCGGAIASPQLLLLSGVGPANELQRLGLDVVQDSPTVGKDFTDHISSGPLRFQAKPGVTWDHYNKPVPGALAMLRWLFTGRGPLAALGTSSGAFVRSDDSKVATHSVPYGDNSVQDMTSGPGAPDLELLWASICFSVDDGIVTPLPETSGITMGAACLKPQSTGHITLASKSIWDKPLIDANYFQSENDVNVILRGTRFLLRMARTEPLASLLEIPNDVEDKTNAFWPGHANPDKVTDADLKAWIRRNAEPTFHAVSTARIGTSLENSVVDPELRVHGIWGLRVADASVFPSQVSGHPCAVVIALAEKAADLIKAAATPEER